MASTASERARDALIAARRSIAARGAEGAEALAAYDECRRTKCGAPTLSARGSTGSSCLADGGPPRPSHGQPAGHPGSPPTVVAAVVVGDITELTEIDLAEVSAVPVPTNPGRGRSP